MQELQGLLGFGASPCIIKQANAGAGLPTGTGFLSLLKAHFTIYQKVKQECF